MIEHDNIFYVRNINKIGGVETYVYELAKKYKDKDIAVVCKTVAPKQKERLKKFCKVYIHKNQQIKCKVIITNWDTSIIDYVNEDAKFYTVLHTDYSHPSQGVLPIDNPRITYIGITDISKKNFEKLSGIDRTILCRNPLSIEEYKKPLVLMSATRLTPEKGGQRMLALANQLDKLCVDYIWFIFTTDEYKNNPVWKNENVIKMDNRLDLSYFYNLADWYIQFSEVEGDSYSLKEALYRNIPIAVCELPYFKEIGIENNKNALYLNLDCSNVEELANKIRKPLKFNFEPIKDEYDKIIVDGKSHYEEDLKMKVKVKAIINFTDMEDNKKRIINEEWICSMDRAEYLKDNKAIEIVEEVKEDKVVLKADSIKLDVKENVKNITIEPSIILDGKEIAKGIRLTAKTLDEVKEEDTLTKKQSKEYKTTKKKTSKKEVK